MAAASFGNYAPAMMEPYPIETALAKEATGGSSAVANMMLNDYWLERQAREASYGAQYADQSRFARQQLAAQMADSYLKTMPELAKANLLGATAPILQSQLPGLNTTGLQFAADQAARTTQAGILKDTGQGAQGFAAGGYGLPLAALSDQTGMAVNAQMPTAVAAQAMANAGRIGAAQIRAAASGGGTTNVKMPPMAGDAGGAEVNLPVPKAIVNQGPEAVTQYMQQHGWGQPSQAPNPNASGAVNTAPPPVRKPSMTNLPPAKTDTPAPKDDTASIAAQAKQLAANSTKLNAQQKADLANPVVRKEADGKIHIYGASGQPYGTWGGSSK